MKRWMSVFMQKNFKLYTVFKQCGAYLTDMETIESN